MPFFFFLHQYLMLMNCGTEPVSPRSILPSLAVAAVSPRALADVEQCHCWRGPSAAGCSGKLAERMICTVKSPRDHCLSPGPGLLFPTREKEQLQEARHKNILPSSEPAWGRGRSGGVWGTRAQEGRVICTFAQHWPRSVLTTECDSSVRIPGPGWRTAAH